MFADREFDFAVTRQRAAAGDAESLRRPGLRDPKVADAVLDDQPRGFLRHGLPGPIAVTDVAFAGHPRQNSDSASSSSSGSGSAPPTSLNRSGNSSTSSQTGTCPSRKYSKIVLRWPARAGQPVAYLTGQREFWSLALAVNEHTRVQALEVRHADGVFWATQYHPEFNFQEMGRLIAARAQPLVAEGFFDKETEVQDHAANMVALHREPRSAQLRAALAVGDDILDPTIREQELRNWVDHLVLTNID